MKIKGLQKFTLVDYPGKIACTIFLFGCNFKCGFCHNPELVLRDSTPTISKEEILDFLKKRKGQLEGVCITGGEPLLTLDYDFVREIKDLGYPIKMDTNGTFPEKLKDLIDAKLIDCIAMDIKSSKENYSKTSGANVDMEKIEKSIKLIANSGLDYEFRTTVVPEIHDEKEIDDLGEWMNSIIGKKPEKYFLQGFRNQGKFIDEKYSSEENITEQFLEKLKLKANKHFKDTGVRC